MNKYIKQTYKISQTKVKKGDKVRVLLGKDSGKEGAILEIDSKKGRVLVEGVNMFKRHVKKMQGIEGGIIEIPKKMNISNVGIVCPNCKKATRVGFKGEGEAKVRVCRKCDKPLDKGAK